MKEKVHKYDDIMNKPRPISNKHVQMSNLDRAAQFAPFAALTGHKERILETERLTTQKKQLDIYQLDDINNKLQIILSNIKCNPLVLITYFVIDSKKDGGKYITVKGSVKKINEYDLYIMLVNGSKIPIKDISEIELL